MAKLPPLPNLTAAANALTTWFESQEHSEPQEIMAIVAVVFVEQALKLPQEMRREAYLELLKIIIAGIEHGTD